MPRHLEEGRYEAEFLISEASGFRSRQRFWCSAPVALAAGALVALIAHGAASAVVAPKAGNVGNGVLTLANPSALFEAKDGPYTVRFDEPVANAGAFQVFDPEGALVGDGKVGVAFVGPVRFTIADGATDFAAGDGFTVTVSHAATDARIVPWDYDAEDGSEVVVGQLLAPYAPRLETGGGVGKTQVVVIERDAEVDGKNFDFPVGADANEAAAIQAAGTAGLLAKNIKVRF